MVQNGNNKWSKWSKMVKNGEADLQRVQRTVLCAQRARRTRSRGPKGLQLEVGVRRAPRLLVIIQELPPFCVRLIAQLGKLAAGCLCASQPTVCHRWQPTHLLPHLLPLPPDFFDRLLACSSISAEVGPSLGPVRHPISLLRLSCPLQLGKGRGAAPRKEAQPHQPDQPDQPHQPHQPDQPDRPDQHDRPDETRKWRSTRSTRQAANWH